MDKVWTSNLDFDELHHGQHKKPKIIKNSKTLYIQRFTYFIYSYDLQESITFLWIKDFSSKDAHVL